MRGTGLANGAAREEAQKTMAQRAAGGGAPVPAHLPLAGSGREGAEVVALGAGQWPDDLPAFTGTTIEELAEGATRARAAAEVTGE
jgi:hypothetical protein